MNVINFIKKHSLKRLIDSYSLRANHHKDYSNLVQLCYDQLNTKSDAISDNCRGLIIDTDTLKVVSFPFTRFNDYNYKTPSLNKVDFNDCTYWKKLDGSITVLYWYDKWHVSTKGLPDASGLIKDLGTTFNDYFWKVWKKSNYTLPTDTNHVYIFELERPSPDFLVSVKQPSITLLGVRSLSTFKEMSVDEASCKWNLDWNLATGKKSSLEDIMSEVRQCDPVLLEGYVVCDSNFQRLKIKSPQYENINLLRAVSSVTDQDRKNQAIKNNRRRMCEIVRCNSHKTFLTLEKYKEHVTLYQEIKEQHTIKTEIRDIVSSL